jgi:hypothetical protein
MEDCLPIVARLKQLLNAYLLVRLSVRKLKKQHEFIRRRAS